MVLSTKLGGAWKEVTSLKVKIAGEWKDVSTLYSKKDGAWVTVYSSGALIEFADYPLPIPVAQGWKYSTDGKVWTTVEADGEINTDGGMFTGFVKANEITLSDYATENVPGETGLRMDGQELSVARQQSTSFVNGEKGYVCGGAGGGYHATVDVYDLSGTRTTGNSLRLGVSALTSFVNASKGYVCGGFYVSTGNFNRTSNVDVYDSSGNMTAGNSLSKARNPATSFVNASKGYVCGGNMDSSESSAVDVYDSSGNRTTGTSLSKAGSGYRSFVISEKGYVCSVDVMDIYDASGNKTTGTPLSVSRYYHTSFVNGNKGYVCGGMLSSNFYSTVDVYDSSGNRSTGTSLSIGRKDLDSFTNGSNGYVCGGENNDSIFAVVDVYDISGNMTTGNDMSIGRIWSTSFVNGDRGYVCGGYSANKQSSVVDIYYDQPEVLYTKLPITAGSTYTLNGESGTATESKVYEFDSKVSGTIKYKAGGLLTDVVLIEYSDYPYPIPVATGWKYSTGGSDWNEVTVDGEINTEGGSFTGSVWANSLVLSDYCTELIYGGRGLKKEISEMSYARADPTAFVNNSIGYVCGGSYKSGSSSYMVKQTETLDKSGTLGSASSLSVGRSNLTSFVNGSKGYVCGGAYPGNGWENFSDTVDVYNSNGILSTGTPLGYKRRDCVAFTLGSKGHVTGGYNSGVVSTHDVYDISGNRTSASSGFTSYQHSASVIKNKAFIFGINNGGDNLPNITYIMDINGNLTQGAQLGVNRWIGTSFTNGDFVYYCAGRDNTGTDSTFVDMYDINNVRTNGAPTGYPRFKLTSFVLHNRGYLCGGNSYDYSRLDVVDVYDEYGVRTEGNPITNTKIYHPASFVNNEVGYVVGGDNRLRNVDAYYDEISYSTKLPITKGSTYALNGTSSTATSSQVLSFNSKVTGKINYAKGVVPSS